MTNQPEKSDGDTSGGMLFEFVDAAHEVTEEERNRPRYGRPVRKPIETAPDAPPAKGQPPAAPE